MGTIAVLPGRRSIFGKRAKTDTKCAERLNHNVLSSEGRRASDGLVTQGLVHASDHPLNSPVAFNSQRLNETCKAKGVLELHLLQKEAAQLKVKYQANVVRCWCWIRHAGSRSTRSSGTAG